MIEKFRPMASLEVTHDPTEQTATGTSCPDTGSVPSGHAPLPACVRLAFPGLAAHVPVRDLWRADFLSVVVHPARFVRRVGHSLRESATLHPNFRNTSTGLITPITTPAASVTKR